MKQLICIILTILTATAFGSGNVEIVDEGFRVMSPDGTQIAFLSSEGLGTFENLKDNSLAVNTAVYTTSGKLLTTTAPTIGTIDFWTRTEGPNTLTTATAGDNIVTTGTVQGGQITSTGNILIADDGFIGSVSEPEAMQIDAFGDVVFTDAVQVGAGFFTVLGTSNFSTIGLQHSEGFGTLSHHDGVFNFSDDILVDGTIIIGDGSSSVASLFLSGSHGLFEIEWEDGEGGNDFLAFRAENTAKWDIHLATTSADMTIIVDGTTGTLTMRNFDVAIEENLELGGDFSADGSDHSFGTFGIATIVTIKGSTSGAISARLNLYKQDNPRGGYIYFDGNLNDFFIGSTSGSDVNAIKIDRGSSKVFLLGNVDVAQRLDCQNLKVEQDGVGIISNVGYSTVSTVAPQVEWSRSRGTQGTPLIVADGDRIGTFAFKGRDDTDAQTIGAAFLINVEGAVATNSVPMEFCFEVMKPGETSRTEAMCIHSSTLVEMFGGLDVTGGESTFGNGTDEIVVSATGDLSFGGGGGLLYGNMDQNGGTFTVTMGNLNQLYELDADTTNISAGPLNDVTFDGDHYLEANTAGIYKIDWSLICQIDNLTGGSEHVEFEILKNGNATGKGESHVTHKNTVRDFPLASTTLLDLAVDDEISIGVTNRTSAGKIITIDHLEMTIFMVGGT